jgi:hypothetical protein
MKNGALAVLEGGVQLKSILITIMLVIVVVSIYNHVVGGSTGTKQQVTNSGGRINGTIQSIDP